MTEQEVHATMVKRGEAALAWLGAADRQSIASRRHHELLMEATDDAGAQAHFEGLVFSTQAAGEKLGGAVAAMAGTGYSAGARGLLEDSVTTFLDNGVPPELERAIRDFIRWWRAAPMRQIRAIRNLVAHECLIKRPGELEYEHYIAHGVYDRVVMGSTATDCLERLDALTPIVEGMRKFAEELEASGKPVLPIQRW